MVEISAVYSDLKSGKIQWYKSIVRAQKQSKEEPMETTSDSNGEISSKNSSETIL